MKTLVIANPVSENGRAGERWPRVEKAISQAIGEHKAVLTKKTGHATRLAREAAEKGVGRIIVFGGDGTVNEVVNGLFEGGQLINRKVILGVIPTGTGGDFRRSLGLNGKASQALEVIRKGHVETIDVGHVAFTGNSGQTEERHFANMTGIGLSGDVMRKVNKARRSKSFGSGFAFKFATLSAMIGHKNRMMRLEIDGQKPIYETACSIHVCNGRFAGGGMMFSPNSELNDGVLDVVLLGDFKVFNFIVESKSLYTGKHIDNPKVQLFKGKEIRISSESDVSLEIDGETPGVLPARFKVAEKSLKVICPPNFGRKVDESEKKKKKPKKK